MSSNERVGPPGLDVDSHLRPGWEAALQELKHQAVHLEARGAVRAAVTLYDAIRIARSGGLVCGEHQAG